MSFVVGGITFKEPNDFSLVSIGSVDGLLTYQGNYVRRVAKADLNLHDHDGRMIRPLQVGFPDASDVMVVGESPCYLQLYKPNGSLGLFGANIINVPSGYVGISKTVGGGYSFKLEGSPGLRTAVAEGWYLYPCSVSLKENIAEIDNPLVRLEPLRGITYEQDGIASAGITAEDLDLAGIPNLTRRDDEGKFSGVNPVGLIPLLVQGLKEVSHKLSSLITSVLDLSNRVTALEKLGERGLKRPVHRSQLL